MGTLYLVSTPIGNLEDLSARAARVLEDVDAVLAEDTRRTRRLMSRLGLSTTLVSLYAHNERARTVEVLSRLGDGARLALVSDAGTPLVSDPGERLVSRALEAGHDVVPVPGPSAVLCALVASGLPSLPFCFLGFPPRKGIERRGFLERIMRSEETVVLFEPPQRVGALFHDLAELGGGDRRAVAARELTKLHEEFKRGTVDSLARYYSGEPETRGELTVVIGPVSREQARLERLPGEAYQVAGALLKAGASPSRASRKLSSLLGISRNRAYRILLDVASPTGEVTDHPDEEEPYKSSGSARRPATP